MANANVSRPGADQQTAGRIKPSIPKEVKLVTQQDGTVVRQTDYESGTVRRTKVFPGDHSDAAPFVRPKSEAQIRAELKNELRAELQAEQAADNEGLANAQAEVLIKTMKPKPKSKRVVKNAVRAAAKTGGITKDGE